MPDSLIIKSLYRLKAEDLLLKRYNVLKDHRCPTLEFQGGAFDSIFFLQI
jgi:hypothetical protein